MSTIRLKFVSVLDRVLISENGMRSRFGTRRSSTNDAGLRAKQHSNRAKIGPRILLVDDDVAIRELARTLLMQAGFEVQLVDHGPTDYAFYNDLRVDAAIIDLGLPGMSRPDVIANLRFVPRNAQLPIIICTSSSNIEDIHACYTDHGALTVIQKPVDWPRLISSLHGAVGKRGLGHSTIAVA